MISETTMTAGELIEYLKRFDTNAKVTVETYNEDDCETEDQPVKPDFNSLQPRLITFSHDDLRTILGRQIAVRGAGWI